MANWSADHHFLGMLYNQAKTDEETDACREGLSLYLSDEYPDSSRPPSDITAYTKMQQQVFANLQFDFEKQPMRTAYIVESISPSGPAVLVKGSGRWGSPLPLTDESWNFMKKNVIVCAELHDETEHRSITIGGDLVYDSEIQVCHWRPREMHPGWNFEGRTPQERHFFAELFRLSFFRTWSRMETLTYAILNPDKVAEMAYYDNLYRPYDGDA